MNDYPVALQSWFNSNTGITDRHWVTITSAEIKVFDFANSTVGHATWGRIRDGVDGYNWSEVWDGNGLFEKASIVFFEV